MVYSQFALSSCAYVGEVAWCGVCACGGCQPAAHSSWTLCEDSCASGGGVCLWSETVWQRPGLAGGGVFVCSMFVFVSCVCVVKVYIHLWNDWLTLGVFVCSTYFLHEYVHILLHGVHGLAWKMSSTWTIGVIFKCEDQVWLPYTYM